MLSSCVNEFTLMEKCDLVSEISEPEIRDSISEIV